MQPLRVRLVLIAVVIVSGFALGFPAASAAALPAPSWHPYPCPATNSNLTVVLTSTAKNGWVGPAGVNVTFQANLSGTGSNASNFSYSFTTGVGSTTGWFQQNNSTGTAIMDLGTWYYALPGNYTANVSVSIACHGVAWHGEGGTNVDVYGPAGINPLHIGFVQSSQFVSGNVTLTANITGRPANSTVVWGIEYPAILPYGNSGYFTATNVTSVVATPLSPGAVYARVDVYYPNHVDYGWAQFATGTFRGADNVTISFTPPPPGSPTSTNLSANFTTAPGAPTVGPNLINWTAVPWSYGAGLTVVGNLSGRTVHPTFFYNTSAPSTTSVTMAASVWALAPVGADAGTAGTYLQLGSSSSQLQISNTTGGTVPPTFQMWLVNSSVNVSHGNMSFTVDATVSAPPPPNSTYAITVNAFAIPGTPPHLVWWNFNRSNWNGSLLAINGSVPVGNYSVNGTAWQWTNHSGSWNVTAHFGSVGLLLSPPAGSSGGGSGGGGTGGGGTGGGGGGGGSGRPLSLAIVVTPTNGTSPVNFTVNASVSGGNAPYSVMVCHRGPSNTSTVTGSCIGAQNLSGTSSGSIGSVSYSLTTAGYYAINATVTDANGSNAWASAVVQVTPLVPRPALTAAASVVKAGGGSGGEFQFLTTISGGVAPYDIQWSFGDGSVGSAVPGETVTHTYTRPGSFVATLSVRDATGKVAVSSVGPFTVNLPSSVGGPAPLSAWPALLTGAAVAVAIASVATLVLIGVWASRRREAVNWLNDLERGGGPKGPSPPG